MNITFTRSRVNWFNFDGVGKFTARVVYAKVNTERGGGDTIARIQYDDRLQDWTVYNQGSNAVLDMSGVGTFDRLRDAKEAIRAHARKLWEQYKAARMHELGIS